MTRRFWSVILASLLVASSTLVPAPALAGNILLATAPQDGDAIFRDLAQQAASAIPLHGGTADFPAGQSAPSIQVLGSASSFWAWDFATNAFYQTSATLVRLGTSSAVYVESGINLAPALLDDIVAKFDGMVYPKVRAAFGDEPNPGIDGDSRVTLLLLNIRDGQYHGGGSYVTGYFSGINEFKQSDLDAWFPGMQKSNEREMLYLDASSPTQVGNNSFNFGIAHEFQHMIQWKADNDEEPWVNEGLSDLAGYLAGFGHAHNHVIAYVANPDDQLTSWSGSLADYGSAYLFFLYSWEHFGGNDFIRSLCASTKNGQAGMDEALAARGLPQRFADVFNSWTVANYLDDLTLAGGIYGYRTLDLVDAGADGLTSFQRPKLTGDYAAYAVSGASTTLRPWSAQYQRFTGGSGSLALSFNGADASAYTVSVVRSSSAKFMAGTNSVETMTLTATQDGSVVVQPSASGLPAILMVAASRSTAVNPAGYTFGASLLQAPTPAPSPTPTRTPSPTPLPTKTVAPLPTPTIAPAPSNQTASISLAAGWNLVSLPLSPSVPLTAEGLIAQVNAQGGQATDVNRWQGGAWNTHVGGLPFNDFAIEAGRGYFVKTGRASVLTVAGQAFTGAQQVSLSAGWNLVAFPFLSSVHTAESLLQSLQEQGGQVLELDRWTDGSWSAHVTGLPFNDFAIDSTQAYFVRSAQAGSWTP